MLFIGLMSLFIFAGCNRSNDSAFVANNNTAMKTSIDCEKKAFTWDWCGSNSTSGTDIAKICYGRYSEESTNFQALKIESSRANEQTNIQCLISFNKWQESTLPGCSEAIVREYSLSEKSGPADLIINECYGADLSLKYISGRISPLQLFKILHP